jgi:hypothetical protein
MKFQKAKALFILVLAFSNVGSLLALESSPQRYISSCESAKKDLKNIQSAQYGLTPNSKDSKLIDMQAEYDKEVARLILLDGMREIKIEFDTFINKATEDLQTNSPLSDSIDELIAGVSATKRLGVMHAMVAELINFQIDDQGSKDFLLEGKLPPLAEGQSFYSYVQNKCKTSLASDKRICVYIDNELKANQSLLEKGMELVNRDIEKTLNGFYNALSKRQTSGIELNELMDYHQLLTGDNGNNRVSDLDNIDTEYYKNILNTDQVVTQALEASVNAADVQMQRAKNLKDKDFFESLAQCKVNRAYGLENTSCADFESFTKLLGASEDQNYLKSMADLKTNLKNTWDITSSSNLAGNDLIQTDENQVAKQTYNLLTKEVESKKESNDKVADKIQKYFNRLQLKADKKSKAYGDSNNPYGDLFTQLQSGSFKKDIFKELCDQDNILLDDGSFDQNKLVTCLKSNKENGMKDITKIYNESKSKVAKLKSSIDSIAKDPRNETLEALKRYAANEVISKCKGDDSSQNNNFIKCNDATYDDYSFTYFTDATEGIIAQIDFDLLDGENKQKEYIDAAYQACKSQQRQQRQYNLNDSNLSGEEAFKQPLSHFFSYTCKKVLEDKDIQVTGTPAQKMSRYFENNNREYRDGDMVSTKRESTFTQISKRATLGALSFAPSFLNYQSSMHRLGYDTDYAIARKQYSHNVTQHNEWFMDNFGHYFGAAPYGFGAGTFYGNISEMYYQPHAVSYQW